MYMDGTLVQQLRLLVGVPLLIIVGCEDQTLPDFPYTRLWRKELRPTADPTITRRVPAQLARSLSLAPETRTLYACEKPPSMRKPLRPSGRRGGRSLAFPAPSGAVTDSA